MDELCSALNGLLKQADPIYQTYTGRTEGDDVYRGLASLGDVELDRRYILLEKELGEGNFGKVYQGSAKITKHRLLTQRKRREEKKAFVYTCIYEEKPGIETIIAIKTLKAGKMSKDQFLNEARIMRKLDHPNIVRLLGVCRDKDPILIITEFMNRGSLDTFLQKDKGKTLNIKLLAYFAEQVTQGMNYLEARHFVHRDLRTANVLINTELEVKVADFGLARLVDLAGVHYLGSASVFPAVWTAPEARYVGTFTNQSDVYSFGCLLYELITYGERPKEDMIAEVIWRPKPSSWSQPFFNIMTECLALIPENRPTFKALEEKFKSTIFE